MSAVDSTHSGGNKHNRIRNLAIGGLKTTGRAAAFGGKTAAGMTASAAHSVANGTSQTGAGDDTSTENAVAQGASTQGKQITFLASEAVIRMGAGGAKLAGKAAVQGTKAAIKAGQAAKSGTETGVEAVRTVGKAASTMSKAAKTGAEAVKTGVQAADTAISGVETAGAAVATVATLGQAAPTLVASAGETAGKAGGTAAEAARTAAAAANTAKSAGETARKAAKTAQKAAKTARSVADAATQPEKEAAKLLTGRLSSLRKSAVLKDPESKTGGFFASLPALILKGLTAALIAIKAAVSAVKWFIILFAALLLLCSFYMVTVIYSISNSAYSLFTPVDAGTLLLVGGAYVAVSQMDQYSAAQVISDMSANLEARIGEIVEQADADEDNSNEPSISNWRDIFAVYAVLWTDQYKQSDDPENEGIAHLSSTMISSQRDYILEIAEQMTPIEYTVTTEIRAETEQVLICGYEELTDEHPEHTAACWETVETGEETECRVLTVTIKNLSVEDAYTQLGLLNEEQYKSAVDLAGSGNDSLWAQLFLGSIAEQNGYEIPAEALTDAVFARMIAEAEKYLGYPYVWGGKTPEDGFDCSGFVSWVIANSDNGWTGGKDTRALLAYCTEIDESEAKPGDLIFFQGTYRDGVSHVGIYVGETMMLHCGSSSGVSYQDFTTPYWESHFLCFGRLP